MNMWTVIFLMFLTLLGLVAWLVYAAAHGSVLALVIVITGGVLGIFVIFTGLEILRATLRDRAEHKRVVSNMQENVGLLNEAFTVQNRALTGANRSLQLGAGAQTKPTIDLPIGMFENVDEM